MRRALLGLLALAACAHPQVKPSPPAAAAESAPAKKDAPPPPCPAVAPAFDPASNAEGLWGAKVAQVCLVGAQEDVTPHLLELLRPREGAALEAQAVSADLELLYKQVVVRDATALVEPLPGAAKRVRLTFLVAEYPRFTELHLTGAKAVSEDTVRSVLELGLPANPVVLRAAMDEVKRSYASIGFADAKVSFELVPLSAGQARLELNIVEGPRLLVGAIRFEGAKRLKPVELKKALQSEVGAPFSQELAERDASALELICFDHGMVQGSVVPKPPQKMKGPEGTVELVFTVQEGPVFRLGQVKVDGLDLGPWEKLAGMETQPKAVFSRSAVTRDIDRLKHLAQQKGAQVEVTPLTEVHAERKTIDLTFSLEPKPGPLRF